MQNCGIVSRHCMCKREIFMKRENEFIISLILCRHNETELQKVRSMIDGDLDWGYISHQIIMHRIAGIVFENLVKFELFYKVPKSIGIFLCDTSTSIQFKQTHYMNEINSITSELDNAKIKYVLIKGIHLITKLYKDFKRIPRDYADVDIVVSKKELNNVGLLLKQLGYEHARLNYYTDELDAIKREEILEGKMFYHQIPPFEKKFDDYYLGRNTYKIDVNYTIFEGGQHEDPISMQYMLDRRIKCSDNLINYYALCTEDDLIQNCYHFYKDIMYPPKNKKKDVYKLVNLYDIYLFISKYRNYLNYSELLSFVEESQKIKQALYIVLELTERVFGSLNIDDFKNRLKCVIPDYVKDLFNRDIEDVIFGTKNF